MQVLLVFAGIPLSSVRKYAKITIRGFLEGSADYTRQHPPYLRLSELDDFPQKLTRMGVLVADQLEPVYDASLVTTQILAQSPCV